MTVNENTTNPVRDTVETIYRAESRQVLATLTRLLGNFDAAEETIEWVKRCSNPMPGESEIEIRQVFEAEDFGAEFTQELREQEDRVRAQAAHNT